MRRFHRWFGIAVAVIFLATGQYMRFVAHAGELPIGPRLLYRSRHIYVLMAALINLTLGAYVVSSARHGARITQVVGSALIAIGSVLLVSAFFRDPRHAALVPLDLVFSSWGVRAVASGTVLHAIASAFRSRGDATAPSEQASERLLS